MISILIFSALCYAVLMSFTPGPNNILAMRYGTTLGIKKVFRFLIGIGFGFFTLSILSLLFSAWLLNLSPMVFFLLKLIGFLYLLYLAYQMVFVSHKQKPLSKKSPTFFQGYMMQFLNPKTLLYVLTTLGTYIVPHMTNKFGLFSWAVIIAFIGFFASYVWALLGCVICKFLTDHEKIFNCIMAVVLFILAVDLLFA